MCGGGHADPLAGSGIGTHLLVVVEAVDVLNRASVGDDLDDDARLAAYLVADFDGAYARNGDSVEGDAASAVTVELDVCAHSHGGGLLGGEGE
jgi:hypothetical protein